jgi:hypothetical protein
MNVWQNRSVSSEKRDGFIQRTTREIRGKEREGEMGEDRQTWREKEEEERGCVCVCGERREEER